MILLIINKPGFIIQIPGLRSIRTPAEIDITKVNTNIVTTYLKQLGINDYKIISSDSKPKTYPKYQWKDLVKKEQNNDKSNAEVSEILTRFIESNTSNIPTEIHINTKDLETKLTEFSLVIEKLIKQVPTTINITGESVTQTTKQKVDDEEKFIPQIKNGEMSLRGNISTIINEENKDVLEIADLLRGNETL